MPRVPNLLIVLTFVVVAALYLFDLPTRRCILAATKRILPSARTRIATTGRSLRGDRWPLFVNLADPLGGKSQVWGDTYYQPILFYVNAIVMTVAPSVDRGRSACRRP